MRNLLKPKWLLLVNTMPIVVLFIISVSQFNIIKSLLEPESIRLWKIFGIALAILAGLNIAYVVFLFIKKKTVSHFYGFIALLVYILYIYFYLYHAETIFPFSIPNWMVSGESIIYVWTFLMPTLAYSLFILVIYFTPETKDFKAWKNFLTLIFIPIGAYLFLQLVLPLWKPVDDGFQTHASIVLIITATLFFLFFLIRAVYIISTKKSESFKRYQLAWKIPIAIILPLLGLFANNGVLFGDIGGGIFGDFNVPWFYILAGLNGLVICLPNLKKRTYRIFLFIARSMCFTFTLYFFLVFLPFLPLSIVAILFIGTGFLMLTPLILFMIHVHELSSDFKFLTQTVSRKILWVISVVCMLLIPMIITIDFKGDKRNLEKVLEYIYTPDYSESYDINEKSLAKTLEMIVEHKNDFGSPLLGSKTPYISSYFNWLVLDNLTLSDEKINKIEAIFLGSETLYRGSLSSRDEHVNITNSFVDTEFDDSQKVWKSWINLEITNTNDHSRQAEYLTTFNLPEGCWISDYYLYVGDRKEKGILAEKKSAMWVFSEIRWERKDPGILYYLTGNKVAFRIFPFAKDEVRQTGIEFIHKEPVKITIDGKVYQLGELGYEQQVIETADMIYIPSSVKEGLNKVQRRPYFHFILDVSEGKGAQRNIYLNQMSNLMEQYPDLSKSARLSKVNSYVETTDANGNLNHFITAEDYRGGFFLERAIRSGLVKSYFSDDGEYPVFIVLTDSIENAILDKDFADLRITYPENPNFYQLSVNGDLKSHSLMSRPRFPDEDSLDINFYSGCLVYQGANMKPYYLPDDSLSSIVLKTDHVSLEESTIKEKDWESALQMEGNWISQNLDPSHGGDEWLRLVESSFVSGVMTPVTSYIVVENDAQKEMLKRKQKQVMSGNKSLDARENVQQMSEPGFVMLLVLLTLFLGFRWKKKRRKELSLGSESA
jgi:hypothetical protein